MKIVLGIGTACLAAGLASPAAFGQATRPAPRARNAAGVQAAETPYLGVGGQDVTSDRAKALKLKEERGVEVTSVEPDSAAAKAGLKEGDVVLEFNGQKVEGWEQLKRLVHETPIHREVKIGVWRNGAAADFDRYHGRAQGISIRPRQRQAVMTPPAWVTADAAHPAHSPMPPCPPCRSSICRSSAP